FHFFIPFSVGLSISGLDTRMFSSSDQSASRSGQEYSSGSVLSVIFSGSSFSQFSVSITTISDNGSGNVVSRSNRNNNLVSSGEGLIFSSDAISAKRIA